MFGGVPSLKSTENQQLLKRLNSDDPDAIQTRIALAEDPNTDFSLSVDGRTQNLFHLWVESSEINKLLDVQAGLIRLKKQNPTVIKALNAQFNNESPLHIAARLNNLEAAEILVNLGANLGLQVSRGLRRFLYNPEQYAEYCGAHQVQEFLRSEGNIAKCLREGNLNRAVELLEKAREVSQDRLNILLNRTYEEGDTLLHLAIKLKGKTEEEILELIKKLIQFGMEIDGHKDSLIVLALRNHLAKISRYLVKELHITPPSHDGQEPILLSLCKADDEENVELLAGLPTTDFSIISLEQKRNVFHFCVEYKRLKALTAICNGLTKPSPINNRTVAKALNAQFYNESPLHIAARSNNLEAAQILVNLGADLGLQVFGGTLRSYSYTPEQYAESYKAHQVQGFLREKRYEANIAECLKDGDLGSVARLLETAKKKSPDELKQILNRTYEDGDTLLHLAIKLKGKTEDEILDLIKKLMQFGMEIDGHKESLILLALRNHFAKISRYLVKELHITPPSHDGQEPILFSLFKADDDQNLELLAEHPKTQFTITNQGDQRNIFHFCAIDKGIKALTAICNGLAKLPGDNPTVALAMVQRSEDDLTPLHCAAKSGDLEMVKLFCSKLKAPWQEGSQEGSAEEIAKRGGCWQVFEYLRELRYGASLLDCIREGAFDKADRYHLREMKKTSGDETSRKKVNVKDPTSQDTPLLLVLNPALKEQRKKETDILKIVEDLIGLGASPDETNGKQENGLLLAFECGYQKVFEFLLSRTNLKAVDVTGRTILHKIANCKKDKIKMLGDLLDRDAELIKLRDLHGKTPLFEVTDPEVLQLLLRKGADPKIKSDGIGVETYFFNQIEREGLLKKLKIFAPDNKTIDELITQSRPLLGHVRDASINLADGAVTTLESVGGAAYNTLSRAAEKVAANAPGVIDAACETGKDFIKKEKK